MLKRLLALSAGTPARELAGLTTLPPVSLLDGFGHAMPPPPDSAPIPARDFSHVRVSPQHPPGLYGAHEVESALNVLHADDRLTPLAGGGALSAGRRHGAAVARCSVGTVAARLHPAQAEMDRCPVRRHALCPADHS